MPVTKKEEQASAGRMRKGATVTKKIHIPLNLAFSYPVAWPKAMVMRDFLQNFFYNSGPEKFGKEFRFHYQEETQTLIMEGNSVFSYEWLRYIGASTKRSSDPKAGKFGEGFKIASLCARRDFHYGVHMKAGNWSLEVSEDTRTVDGQEIAVLAYDIEEYDVEDDISRLTLSHVHRDDFTGAFMDAMDSFLYKGNRLVGQTVFQGQHYGVYHRNGGKGGCLFAGYQKRAVFSRVPLVFRYDWADDSDRQRKELKWNETEDAILNIITHAAAAHAAEILEAMEPVWRMPQPKSGYSREDWTNILKALIRRVASDRNARQAIANRHAGKYICDIQKDVTMRYNGAKRWYRTVGKKKYGLLPDFFKDLGLPGMDEACEREDGYPKGREPDETEFRMVRLLESGAKKILWDYLCYDSHLPVSVISGELVGAQGLVVAVKALGNPKNKAGLPVVSKFGAVCLEERLFYGGYGKAFAVYSHELMHQFGGDCSAHFHTALLELNRRIIGSRNLEPADQGSAVG